MGGGMLSVFPSLHLSGEHMCPMTKTFKKRFKNGKKHAVSRMEVFKGVV